MRKEKTKFGISARSFFVSVILLFSFFSVSQVAATCPSGMVGYWKGDGNGNDQINGNTMNLYNDRTFATYAPGKVGQAFNFGGGVMAVYEPWGGSGYDWVHGGYGETSSPIYFSANQDVTFETWINIDPTGSDTVEAMGIGTVMVALYSGGIFAPQLWVWSQGNGDYKISCSTTLPCAWRNEVMSSYTVHRGTWHHVALVYDSMTKNHSCYIDGALGGSMIADTPGTGPSNRPLRLSAMDYECTGSGSRWNFKGLLDEVAVYNSKLTSPEIQQHYQNGLQNKDYCGVYVPTCGNSILDSGEQCDPPQQVCTNSSGGPCQFCNNLCLYQIEPDGDGILDPFDNCPTVANLDQVDTNGNGVGDACEPMSATLASAQAGENRLFTVNSTVKCQNAGGCGSLTATLNLKGGLVKMYSWINTNNMPSINNLGTDESDKINLVLASDDNRFGTSTGDNTYESQSFVFSGINSNPSRITLTWEGYQSANWPYYNIEMYVYDYSTSSWSNIGNYGAWEGEQTHTHTICGSGCDITANPVNFVSPNNQVTAFVRVYYWVPNMNSCPFLYTWNGTGYEFIADINSNGGLGYADSYAPGAIANSDPYNIPYGKEPLSEKDYMAIDGSQLKAVNGSYSISIAEDASEVSYMDEAKLLVVDHAPGVEIYSPVFTGIDFWTDQPFDKYILHTVKNPQKPVAAYDENGNNILPVISELDNKYTDWFGQLQWKYITVDLGDLSDAEQIKLLYNAYSDWALGDDYNARYQYLMQHPDEPFYMVSLPYMEVVGADGSWVYAPELEQIGSAHGYPRTLLWDVTDWFDANGRTNFTIRIHSFQRIPIDYIAVDTSVDEPLIITTLDPSSAELGYKGMSKMSVLNPISGPEASSYYDTTTSSTQVKGDFTRYGDVLPLLQSTDDKYIIMAPGDQAIVKFDEVPQKSGMERDYYLYSTGYFKGSNNTNNLGEPYIKTAPLPFVEMSTYPYNTGIENYPYDAEHNAYIAEYNTRYIDTTSGHHTILTDYISIVSDPPGLLPVPVNTGSFYTTSSNPQTSANAACLANMANGQSCTVSWTMKAEVSGKYKLFATYTSTVLSSTNSPYAVVEIGGAIPDMTPPETTIAISGASQVSGVYTSNVSVTSTATDDISGVKETKYKIDNDDWNTYSVPFPVPCDLYCEKTVYYYSVDNNDNVEDTKSTVISIDKRTANETVSTSGGTVSNEAGTLIVEIPSGALSAALELTVVTSERSFAPWDLDTWQPISQPLDIGPQCADIDNEADCQSTSGCEFNYEMGNCQSVRLNFAATITMPGNCSKDLISQRIMRFNEVSGSWEPVSTCTELMDMGGGVFSCVDPDTPVDRVTTWNTNPEVCTISVQTYHFSTYGVAFFLDDDNDGVWNVNDECKADAGIAAFNGCNAAISVRAENHTKVTVGKTTTSVKLPLAGLQVEVYDMQCVKNAKLTPAAKDFDAIRAACPVVVKKTTSLAGTAFLGAMAGKEYIIIGVLNGMTNSQLSTPTGTILEGQILEKKLQYLTVPDITKMPPLNFLFDAIENGNFAVFVVTVAMALGLGYYFGSALGKKAGPTKARKRKH